MNNIYLLAFLHYASSPITNEKLSRASSGTFKIATVVEGHCISLNKYIKQDIQLLLLDTIMDYIYLFLQGCLQNLVTMKENYIRQLKRFPHSEVWFPPNRKGKKKRQERRRIHIQKLESNDQV